MSLAARHEPDHLDSLIVQPHGAPFVPLKSLGIVVREAVHLDRKLPFGAVKVEDEGADRVLPAETKAVDLSASDKLPEDHLGQGHFAAHAFGAAKAFR